MRQPIIAPSNSRRGAAFPVHIKPDQPPAKLRQEATKPSNQAERVTISSSYIPLRLTLLKVGKAYNLRSIGAELVLFVACGGTVKSTRYMADFLGNRLLNNAHKTRLSRLIYAGYIVRMHRGGYSLAPLGVQFYADFCKELKVQKRLFARRLKEGI